MKRILLTTVSLGVLGLMSPAFGADLPMLFEGSGNSGAAL